MPHGSSGLGAPQVPNETFPSGQYNFWDFSRTLRELQGGPKYSRAKVLPEQPGAKSLKYSRKSQHKVNLKVNVNKVNVTINVTKVNNKVNNIYFIRPPPQKRCRGLTAAAPQLWFPL